MNRRSDYFFLSTGVLILLCLFAMVHAHMRQDEKMAVLDRNGALVRRLGLTDLCLFTDARYCRHPSMADRNTAFQDYPMSFEHFPSGALFVPPPHLRTKAK